MAAPQRLGEGQLTASAQPVSTFMSYDARSTPATPTRLPQMPNVQRVTAFQRGGMRDVQGVNSVQELSEALAPLTKLYDAGAQMYASDQYRRGQNEILKAAANINRDQQVKSLAYAQENRELSASNPIAGVLMDRANPFRQAGRVNQASQYVASLAQQQFKAEWAQSGSSLKWRRLHARMVHMQSFETEAVVQKTTKTNPQLRNQVLSPPVARQRLTQNADSGLLDFAATDHPYPVKVSQTVMFRHLC